MKKGGGMCDASPEKAWRAFCHARRILLQHPANWRAPMEESLKQLAQMSATTPHEKLLTKTAATLLELLHSAPDTSSTAWRLSFFEKSYRFTRIGGRLFDQ